MLDVPDNPVVAAIDFILLTLVYVVAVIVYRDFRKKAKTMKHEEEARDG